MKQLISTLIIILLFTACQSNESKIKSMMESSEKLKSKIIAGNNLRETLTDKEELRISDSTGNSDKKRFIELMKQIDSLVAITPVK